MRVRGQLEAPMAGFLPVPRRSVFIAAKHGRQQNNSKQEVAIPRLLVNVTAT
jgi:hypothetical protein